MRQRVRELEERERKESKKLADEDALRKLRVAEETIEHLQKKLTATKQVCLVLLYFLSVHCFLSDLAVMVLVRMLIYSIIYTDFITVGSFYHVYVAMRRKRKPCLVRWT